MVWLVFFERYSEGRNKKGDGVVIEAMAKLEVDNINLVMLV